MSKFARSVFLMALVAVYMTSYAEAKSNRRIFKAITKGMSKAERRVLKTHCKVRHVLDNGNEIGFARWKNVVLKCDNLEEESIPVVECDKRCVNPKTCKRLSRDYCVVPVHIEQLLRRRNGELVRVKIPVACQCVARSKGRGNRSDKSGRCL